MPAVEMATPCDAGSHWRTEAHRAPRLLVHIDVHLEDLLPFHQLIWICQHRRVVFPVLHPKAAVALEERLPRVHGSAPTLLAVGAANGTSVLIRRRPLPRSVRHEVRDINPFLTPPLLRGAVRRAAVQETAIQVRAHHDGQHRDGADGADLRRATRRRASTGASTARVPRCAIIATSAAPTPHGCG
jgi:hypothetical protein